MSAALLACLLGPLVLGTPFCADDPHFLEGAERETFLGELESRMAARKSVVAEFEQEKVLALFEEPLKSRGAILFEAPTDCASCGKLRWEILEPFRSILIVAGKDVAKFEFTSDGERRVLELGRAKDPLLAVMDQIRGWFLGRFDRRESSYALKVARQPEPMIVLEPKDAGLKRNMRAIEVRLASELDGVRSVTILEVSGDRTTMRFQERRKDLAIPAACFDLRAPAELELEKLLPGPGK